MKSKFFLVLTLIVIGLISTFFFFKKNDLSREELTNQLKKKVSERSFSGIVKEKIKDSDFHDRDIIYISNKENTLVTDFVYEDSSLFNFIKVGDSIIKKKDDLNVRIIRKELDTLIPLTFKKLRVE